MRLISRPDWKPQPWKNGGGVTQEIWRFPDLEDYDLRVSLAEVTCSGPFSRFPGYRRWSFLVGTSPIELAASQTTLLVAPGDHIELPGDTPIVATLHAGPTHVLNIFARTQMMIGRGGMVGHGPIARPVQFVFALAPQPGLATWDSMVLDPPSSMDTHDCVWIA